MNHQPSSSQEPLSKKLLRSRGSLRCLARHTIHESHGLGFRPRRSNYNNVNANATWDQDTTNGTTNGITITPTTTTMKTKSNIGMMLLGREEQQRSPSSSKKSSSCSLLDSHTDIDGLLQQLHSNSFVGIVDPKYHGHYIQSSPNLGRNVVKQTI